MTSPSKNNLELERLYRSLFDPRTHVPTENGLLLIQSHHINAEMLKPRTMAEFTEEFEDRDIARLHFQHYQRRRNKLLLKI